MLTPCAVCDRDLNIDLFIKSQLILSYLAKESVKSKEKKKTFMKLFFVLCVQSASLLSWL